MKHGNVSITRTTGETDITVALDMTVPGVIAINTSLPFFDHMLTAMSFHGGFSLSVTASGDTEADGHHLVEDTGIVLGQVLRQWASEAVNVHRFGHAVIPMDEALSEVTVDVSGRSHLAYRADYPQGYCGSFDTSLIKEFLLGLVRAGGITLHADLRYGENSHHMAESLFKALGKSLASAYMVSQESIVQSTKGIIE